MSVPSIAKLLPSFFLICITLPLLAMVKPDNPELRPDCKSAATCDVLRDESLVVSSVTVTPSTVTE